MHNLTFKQFKPFKKTGSFRILAAVIVLSACNNNSKKEEVIIENSAPIISNIMVTTQTEVNIEDMLTASDPDGDLLTYSLINEPTLGVVVVNADGSYIYTPNKEVTGSDSFIFSIDDQVNPKVNGTVSITIETLEVDFVQFTADTFNQELSSVPLSVNGRMFINIGEESNFDNLFSQ